MLVVAMARILVFLKARSLRSLTTQTLISSWIGAVKLILLLNTASNLCSSVVASLYKVIVYAAAVFEVKNVCKNLRSIVARNQMVRIAHNTKLDSTNH